MHNSQLNTTIIFISQLLHKISPFRQFHILTSHPNFVQLSTLLKFSQMINQTPARQSSKTPQIIVQHYLLDISLHQIYMKNSDTPPKTSPIRNVQPSSHNSKPPVFPSLPYTTEKIKFINKFNFQFSDLTDTEYKTEILVLISVFFYMTPLKTGHSKSTRTRTDTIQNLFQSSMFLLLKLFFTHDLEYHSPLI